MTGPTTAAGDTPADQVLEIFGETVILRRGAFGAPVDTAVIEEIVPPGVTAPWHRHTREDEVCYVIEGTFRIWRGEEVFDFGPGGVALLPRGGAYTFGNVGPGTGRLLPVITPVGIERFFQVVAKAA